MSTLGRKAIKKTLERLRKDALSDTGKCLNTFDKFLKKIDEMSKEERKLLEVLTEYTPRAVISLLRYIQALEDYGYELDEEWDRLLQTVKQTQERTKPTQKKPSYRV